MYDCDARLLGSNLVTPLITRDFDKYHLHFRLRALDPFFDLSNRIHDATSIQIISQLYVRIDENLFRR